MSTTFDQGRRAFLGLGARGDAPQECHISSLLVHMRPELQEPLAAMIGALPGIEIQSSPMPGKLVVTLETRSTQEIMDRLTAIQDLRGIISATLVYHQWEADEDQPI